MAKKPGPLSLISEVLDETSLDELKAFFQWYLRTDSRAQMQLLARFSDKIAMEESEKYEWLFYKAIQKLRGSSSYLGISKQKSVLKIYRELFQQAADALAINHYVKTFYILSNGLVFIRLLSQKEKTLHKDYEALFTDYMDLLFRLYEADLPRDLIHRIVDFVDHEIQLERKLNNTTPNTFIRLKLRLEYQHNGYTSLKKYIDEHWTIASLKSAEQLADFYYTLFTESWASDEIERLSALVIPREVMKIVLLRLFRDDMGQTIGLLWQHYQLSEQFKGARYNKMVERIQEKFSDQVVVTKS